MLVRRISIQFRRIPSSRSFSLTPRQDCSRSTTMAVQQPRWSLPTQTAPEPVLKVYNSLTRTKVRHPIPRSVVYVAEALRRRSSCRRTGGM